MEKFSKIYELYSKDHETITYRGADITISKPIITPEVRRKYGDPECLVELNFAGTTQSLLGKPTLVEQVKQTIDKSLT